VTCARPAPGIHHVVIPRAQPEDRLPGCDADVLLGVGFDVTGAQPGRPPIRGACLLQRPAEHFLVKRLAATWVKDESALACRAGWQRLIGHEPDYMAAADPALQIVHRAERRR